MKITEILTESQLKQLDEGPILNKIGSGIGKAVGTAGKAIGAVAGGVAGAVDAAKKGFSAGRSAVAGGGDKDPQAAPTSAADINAAGPKGTAAAKTQTGAAAQAINKTAQATQGANAEKVGQTVYAQVKSQVNQLDKKGKQRIMQLLQKSLAAPAAKPAAAPAANTQAAPANPGLQAGGSGNTTNAPADPNAKAAPPEPGDQRWYNDRVGQWGWKGASGGWQGDEQDVEPTPKKARTKKAAPSQATIDADRNRLMGNFTDSVVNNKLSLEETLAQKIKEQKRKIFENDLVSGQTSIFKK
jgi:hypothetical protein